MYAILFVSRDFLASFIISAGGLFEANPRFIGPLAIFAVPVAVRELLLLGLIGGLTVLGRGDTLGDLEGKFTVAAALGVLA